MEEQPTFSGIGSTCFIIPKADLQPDTLTPKEGKAWSKIDVNKSYSISVDVEPSDDFKPFEIPIERERQLFSHESLTSEQLYEIAKRTGFVQKEAVETMMQFEQDKAKDSCKELWEQIQNAPFDVFITDKDSNALHIGKVDPKNITVRRIAVNEPQFRRRRLRVKFRKKLMHYLVRYESREPFDRIERDIYLNSPAAPTTRRMSHLLNQKIKFAKRSKQYDYTSSQD